MYSNEKVKKKEGKKMKKLMLVLMLVGMGMVNVVLAGDIYAVKMSCKVPVISLGSQSYYKDFKMVTYRGYVDVVYGEDGNISPDLQAVLYGDFTEGKATRNVLFDFNNFNVYGPKRDKAEVNIIGNFGNFNVNLSGNGKIVCQVAPGSDCCGVAVEPTCRLNSASGYLTGWIDDVLCAPCNNSPWTWQFNNYWSEMINYGTFDVVYGSWTMMYNKTLTVRCSGQGFPDCVTNMIPSQYR